MLKEKQVYIFVLLAFTIFLTSCNKAGMVVGDTYMDEKKYFFQITKKVPDIFFEIEKDEVIKIVGSDNITGIWIYVIPSSDPRFSSDPKKLLKNFIPSYKKDYNKMKLNKDKCGKENISGAKAYRVFYLGDIGWKPTNYVFWGIVPASQDRAFVIIAKAQVEKWSSYKKGFYNSVRSFTLLRK